MHDTPYVLASFRKNNFSQCGLSLFYNESSITDILPLMPSTLLSLLSIIHFSSLFTFHSLAHGLGWRAIRNNRETTVFKSSDVPGYLSLEAYRLPPRDSIDFTLRRDEKSEAGKRKRYL